MGSWNKTCAISNLHINAYEEVYVFVLERSKFSQSYTSGLYSPLLLPFTAKYNDYGAGEANTGIAIPYILQGIVRDLVELEGGKNQYHDIAVKKEGFNLDTFYEATREDRLMVNHNKANKTHVTFTMIKKSVADSILDNYTLDRYVDPDKPYEKITYQSAVDSIPAFLATIQDAIAKNTNRYFLQAEMVFDYKDSNHASYIFKSNSDYKYSNIIRIFDLLVQLIENDALTEATGVMEEYLKGCMLDIFMDYSRKSWLPGMVESQNIAHSAHECLANIVLETLNQEKKQYEEDMGEPYSE